jgi:hypothetical protein
MTSYKLIGAALALSVIAIAPVSAQQVIDEPGAFAFYHPNADVLNGGRPLGSSAMAQAPSLRSATVTGTQMSVRSHRANNAKRY